MSEWRNLIENSKKTWDKVLSEICAKKAASFKHEQRNLNSRLFRDVCEKSLTFVSHQGNARPATRLQLATPGGGGRPRGEPPRWTSCHCLQWGDSDGVPTWARSSMPWGSPPRREATCPHEGLSMDLQTLRQQRRDPTQVRLLTGGRPTRWSLAPPWQGTRWWCAGWYEEPGKCFAPWRVGNKMGPTVWFD